MRVLVVRIVPRGCGGVEWEKDGPARCTVGGLSTGRRGTYAGVKEVEPLPKISVSHAKHVALHRHTGRSFVVAFMVPLRVTLARYAARMTVPITVCG